MPLVIEPRTILCPECHVPFIRHGQAERSSGFYRDNEDVCICCREDLDPVTLLPLLRGNG